MSHAQRADLGWHFDHLGGMINGQPFQGHGATFTVHSPIDRQPLATLQAASADQLQTAITHARAAFEDWRRVPAPRRGELVRKLGLKLRERKDALAQLVTLEAGKIHQEALGEVQEMIDICDFAVGLSRQLYGLTIASERPAHRMAEHWHPLGPIAIITAFNFPVAVWAWNAALGLVCGNTLLWKPSEKTPLCALACQQLLSEVITESGIGSQGISHVLVDSGSELGQAMAQSPHLPLVSATGSVRMGRSVAQTVGGRLGRCLLELGGNNALIVSPSASLDLALRAIVFSAAGTAGQRCTTLRRLIVHRSVRDALVPRIARAFDSIRIGDPRDPQVLVGPLIDAASGQAMQAALAAAVAQGGRVITGGQCITQDVPAGGCYVRPALVEIAADAAIVQHETFAPILYVMTYEDFDQAVAIQNNVPQGLSSALCTQDLLEAERFLGPAGSDCGLANINMGTSGAEIGGAFGGEKETGGGRESGSDAWKSYMRRQTQCINYSADLPLAQGVRFDATS